MPRMARLDAPGTLHHVIVRGIEKRRIVDDRMDREKFVLRMGGTASTTGTLIYAWALMGNHAHVLLRSGPVGLAPCMRRFLTGYAMDYNRRHVAEIASPTSPLSGSVSLVHQCSGINPRKSAPTPPSRCTAFRVKVTRLPPVRYLLFLRRTPGILYHRPRDRVYDCLANHDGILRNAENG
jgi:hypothetical protein